MQQEELPPVSAIAPDDDAGRVRWLTRHRQAVPSLLHSGHKTDHNRDARRSLCPSADGGARAKESSSTATGGRLARGTIAARLPDYEPSPVGARLVFIALRVRDLEASVRFYRDAIGIPLREAGGVDEETHREYSWTDGAYLHFALFPATAEGQTRRAEIAFYVDDVDAAHARAVAACADVATMPREESWGRTASYRDPDGNVVALTQRPDPGRP